MHYFIDPDLARYNANVTINASDVSLHSEESSGGSEQHYNTLDDIQEVLDESILSPVYTYTDDLARGFGFASAVSMMSEITIARTGLSTQKKFIFCHHGTSSCSERS